MNKQCSVNLKKSTLIAFLALVPFFEPTYVSTLPLSGTLYDFYKLLVFMLSLFYFIVLNKKIKRSVLIVLLSEFSIFVFTCINNGLFSYELKNLSLLISLVFLIHLFLDNIKSFLSALMLHFEICIYINLLTLILFPNRLFGRYIAAYGYTFEWFLGPRNSFITWLLPSLVIALLYREYNKDSYRWKAVICAVFITQLFQTSSTLLVSSTVFFILLLVPCFNLYFKPMICFLISLVIQFMVVILNDVSFLAPVVQGMLGKDLTFTNRTMIWKNAISNINFRGYGVLEPSKVASILGKFGDYVWIGATHAHNQLLNIAFQGGFISLFLTIFIYFIAFKKLEIFWDKPIARVLAFGLFSYIIAGYTEVTNHLLLQLVVILPLFIEDLVKIDKENCYY